MFNLLFQMTNHLFTLVSRGCITLFRDLSTCSGERNAKMVDTSELLRVFGPFEQLKGEHHSGQVSEQR
ncbi:hypothetical protein ACSLOS_32260, partial [Klebsiella pneumoniae]